MRNIGIKLEIGLLILALINAIFVYKYGAAFLGHSVFIFMGLIVLYYLFFSYLWKGLRFKNLPLPGYVLCGGMFLIVLGLSLTFVDKESLGIDRWSVVESFWDAVFNGEYPYSAYSHMGNLPGPFPFYFLICLPFMLVRMLGLLTVATVVMFLILMKRKIGRRASDRLALGILFSPWIYYEIAVQSNVFSISVLFALSSSGIGALFESKNVKPWARGLLLSTRGVYLLPVLRDLGSIWRGKGFRVFLSEGLISFVAFALTFAPILLFWPGESLLSNPFITQAGTFLSLQSILLFAILAFILGVLIYKEAWPSIIFADGMLLLLPVLWYFLTTILELGWEVAIFDDHLDLTYLLLPLPFILIASFASPSLVDRNE